LKYLFVVLMIAVTSLFFAGAIVLVNWAAAAKGHSYDMLAVYLSSGLFCFIFGAVSAIMLIETTYRAAKRQTITEDSIGKDWNPMLTVLLVAVAPVIFCSFIVAYFFMSSLPPTIYVPTALFAILAILILLWWFFGRSEKSVTT